MLTKKELTRDASALKNEEMPECLTVGGECRGRQEQLGRGGKRLVQE